MAAALPLIDIAPLRSQDAAARRAVAALIGDACRSTGFFAITGHGLPANRIEAAFAAASAVFALPAAVKAAHAIGRLGDNRGYVGLGIEALDEKAAADLKEAWNLVWCDVHPEGLLPGSGLRPVGSVWPPLPGWQDCMTAYFEALLDIGRRLHQAFALDLGQDEHFFADKLDQPMATLRLLRYPDRHGQGDPAAAAPGAGVHTDYGNVTLLATDGVAGLQVRRRDGGWIDVPPVPGGFICNIGDCLMRWTNDVYVSTPHRVLPPPRERYSIAFFLDPNPQALVAAIPGCVPAGQVARYAPTTALDHLRSRLDATYKASGAR